jgi:hypothetical protein
MTIVNQNSLDNTWVHESLATSLKGLKASCQVHTLWRPDA